jgi:hypothetical protein
MNELGSGPLPVVSRTLDGSLLHRAIFPKAATADHAPFSNEIAQLLTFGSLLRYRAAMPIQFILPKKFTRAEIEWRMDELALEFQGTKDKKLIAQIAALNRVLTKMDAQSAVNFRKNRQ